MDIFNQINYEILAMKFFNTFNTCILFSMLPSISLLTSINNKELQAQFTEVPNLQNIILDQYGPWYAQQVAQAIENNEEEIDPINNIALPPYLFSQYLNDYYAQDSNILIDAQFKKNSLKYTLFLLHANVNINKKDALERTALYYATSTEVALLLIKHKALINEKDILHETPVCVQLRLCNQKYGMKTDATLYESYKNELMTRFKVSEFDMLINKLEENHLEHLKIAEILINSKTNINNKNCREETPLHIATRSEYPLSKAIRLLIINGADTTLQDMNDKTAFDYLEDFPDLQKVFREAVAYRKLPESEKMGLEDFRS